MRKFGTYLKIKVWDGDIEGLTKYCRPSIVVGEVDHAVNDRKSVLRSPMALNCYLDNLVLIEIPRNVKIFIPSLER